MTDLTESNALFERGIALGLTWTTGETAENVPTIYLPIRHPESMRASLYPFAHNWILNWTTSLYGTETITVDKQNREADTVLRAVSAAIQLAIERCIEAEPESALGLSGFLGALGIALEDDSSLSAATAARKRALALQER